MIISEGATFRQLIYKILVTVYLKYKGVEINSIRVASGMPRVRLVKNSKIVIGNNVDIISLPSANPIGINHPVILSTLKKNALLKIGDDVGLSGTSIIADKEVFIGNKVLFGANVVVSDTDFHPLGIVDRRYSTNAVAEPVYIGDHVFIGMNSIILKGVTIGDYAVIGAGSVVTKNVPEHAIFAGNPAKLIRFID